MKKARKLTPKQATFVAEYLKDSNGTRAAIAAGYSPRNARHQAWELLHKQPSVVEALEETRKASAKKAEYNLDTAMKEAEEAIEFSKNTKNANAYVKAVELRTKLNGLLIEKHDVRHAGFQLIISGIKEPK